MFKSALFLLFLAPTSSKVTYRPFEALDQIAPLLTGYESMDPDTLTLDEAITLFKTAADAFSASRNYPELTKSREKLLHLRTEALETAPSTTTKHEHLLSRVALIEAFTNEDRFDKALKTVSAAMKDAKSSPGLLKGLQRAKAQVLNCAGHGVDALKAFEAGLPTPGWPSSNETFPTSTERKLALDYFLLLSRVDPGRPSIPAKLDRVGSALLKSGYTSTLQLPRSFNPKLHSQPWYDPTHLPPAWEEIATAAASGGAGSSKALSTLLSALTAATHGLTQEYLALKSTQSPILKPEVECIHDPTSSPNSSWTYATVNAPWVREVDEDGCAQATPIACSILRLAASVGYGGGALRGTFSAVAGVTHLRPHCGLSNAQIKVHLGLIVPHHQGVGMGEAGGVAAGSTPCSHITVGEEEPRHWEVGGLLMFDDSFQHHVHHACEAERVVFQLVIPHGDVRGRHKDSEFSGGD